MPENIRERVQETVSAAREGRIPDQVRELAEENVARGRDAYGQFSTVANEGLKNMEEAIATGYDNAKALNAQLLRNVVANTEAAFDAATSMASAKSLPEAAQIYARFMQQQLATMSRQTQEFLELSANTAKSAVDEAGAVASRTTERARKVGK